MNIITIRGFEPSDIFTLISPEQYSKSDIEELVKKTWENLNKPSSEKLTAEEIEKVTLYFNNNKKSYPTIDEAIDEYKYWKDHDFKRALFSSVIQQLILQYNFREIGSELFVDAENILTKTVI